ncbi:MAG: hypothetical protein R3B70_03310 [Polyangiaceae bacterium]
MPGSSKRERRVSLSMRVPAEHAEAVKAYADKLAAETGLVVSPSAAGAAILDAGLRALGLLSARPATGRSAGSSPSSKTASRRGPKR